MAGGNANIALSEIVTAVAQELRDEEFGRLGRPFYVSAIQRALGEMNKRTNFFKKDFVTEVPINRVLELPHDLTEKDQAYLFNGDSCGLTNSTILFIKPNMVNFGGLGYIAQNKGLNLDGLQWSLDTTQLPPSCLFFAGERMGKLYLSPSCSLWQRIYIPYTGIGVDCFGEDFVVPFWCREAITDWAIHRAALAMEREDPQFLARIIARKEGELKSPSGTWWTAIGDYKRMDKQTRYDTIAYTTRFGHFP